jgi:hypothetical protein
VVLGLELKAIPPALLGWLWTMILLISASWVARIIGMNYWCPASNGSFYSWPSILWETKQFWANIMSIILTNITMMETLVPSLFFVKCDILQWKIRCVWPV